LDVDPVAAMTIELSDSLIERGIQTVVADAGLATNGRVRQPAGASLFEYTAPSRRAG